MMPNYENETCEGCAAWDRAEATCLGDSSIKLPYEKACDNIVLSLECRKVMALEALPDRLVMGLGVLLESVEPVRVTVDE
jgi:hypothetical protein